MSNDPTRTLEQSSALAELVHQRRTHSRSWPGRSLSTGELPGAVSGDLPRHDLQGADLAGGSGRSLATPSHRGSAPG